MTLQEINDELTERQLDTEEYILDDQTNEMDVDLGEAYIEMMDK